MATSKKSETKKSKKEMLSLSGRMRVYRGQYGFSTSFGAKSKDEEDEYINGYMNVQFRKDDQPSITKKESCEINVINGFISCYESKDGDVKLKMVILEYDEV